MLSLCVAATGVQWDLLQVVAWGRMMTRHAEHMPLTEAVSKTFDGEMCGLCRIVARAGKTEQSRTTLPNGAVQDRMLLLVGIPPRIVLGIPAAPLPRPADKVVPANDRPEPRVPPPRAALA